MTKLDPQQDFTLVEGVNDIDPATLDSLVLARLMREVQDGAGVSATAYNRTYHRHNR